MARIHVKDLMEKLSGASPEAVVLVPERDHSYREQIGVSATTALYDRSSRTWTEDHGEALTPEAEYGERVPVFVIE